jgi:hypothetical protein
MISTCVLIFLAMTSFIFWVGGLVEKPTYPGEAARAVPEHGSGPPGAGLAAAGGD